MFGAHLSKIVRVLLVVRTILQRTGDKTIVKPWNW